jgi:hypothetical protein
LKNLLKEKYTYIEQNDSFTGITSKYLPTHSDFMKFWENTIQCDYGGDLFDNEIEVDELSSLFKLWAKEQKSEPLLTNGTISEENIVKILKHFLPSIEIIEEKYILNISSNMWNKIKDIENFLIYMKKVVENEKNVLPLISFDDTYNHYYKFCNIQSLKFIVSKRYFEKYLYFKLSHHIVYEKFIETSWFHNV